MNSTTPSPPDSPLCLLERLEVRSAGDSALPETPLESSVVTIGNFDGIHIAHKSLLLALVKEASSRGVPSVALTFSPHPAQFLRPESGMTLLMPIEERIRGMKALGVDRVVVLRFDETLASMPAEDFVRVVISAFQPSLFVIGPDTRFGQGRKGDSNLLMSMGGSAGFDVLPMETVSVDGQRISSSGLRQCLSIGDVSTPRKWCKAPFAVEGSVVHGDGRGRTLGFRTANIDSNWPTMPAPGVYVVQCLLGESARHFGVANLGYRPTFESSGVAEETLEVHLLADDVSDLYGQNMRVEFLKRLRGEMRFADSDALVAQINKDIVDARAVIEGEAS